MGHENAPAGCACAVCATKLPFSLDEHLIHELERYNCFLFAGAGISTETRYCHPRTFFQELVSVTNCSNDTPFCTLIDNFEAQPNGRQKLIQLIVDRFAYIDGFRELKGTAPRFHNELATMPYLRPIVTTNWDRYFEQFCSATPFVYEADMAFWNDARRPLLKLHGSIDNYSSIVASTSDYENCEERLNEGITGAVLKQLFATKTCVFFGYSATDQDFLKIYNRVKSGAGQFARTHYLVSPFVDDAQANRLLELNIVSIKTDASYFLQIVKNHMEKKFCLAKDESYDQILSFLYLLLDAHSNFTDSYTPGESPHLIFCSVFQDGLIHALGRISDRRPSGEYTDLHYVRSQIAQYEQMISVYARKRDYWEVSYFTGYQLGLIFFECLTSNNEEIEYPPIYFHPGLGLIEEDEYEKLVKPNPDVHKAALAQARRILKRSGANAAETIQHLPWG